MVEFKQDLAGVGGDVNYLKTMLDTRFYHEVMPDVVGMVRFQGGHATGWGGKDLRMLDHFQGGTKHGAAASRPPALARAI